MSYMYGMRGTCKETPLTSAIRAELYTQPYGSIDWNAARNLIAKEDLYYPHPTVQDVLWWTLYQAEGLLKGSRLRKAALAECMKHIHYEVGVGSSCRAGEGCRGYWGACLPANTLTVEGLHQAAAEVWGVVHDVLVLPWLHPPLCISMLCQRCHSDSAFVEKPARPAPLASRSLTASVSGGCQVYNLLLPAAGREHALCLHWPSEQGAQHAVLLV